MNERHLAELETLVLPRVAKPGRYAGGEWNAVVKDWGAADVRMALSFPDVYEVGMSNLGFQIIYHLVNNIEWALCERAFAPWPDMEQELRNRKIPLYSLESRAPLREFDIIGFSLGYEMGYTNILTVLDLGGAPLRASERGEGDPLVLGGGCAVFNPEPVADFFDLFLLGEAEEALPELLGCFRNAKSGGVSRDETLRELSRIPGVYVPSMYEAKYEGGAFAGIEPRGGAPEKIFKRYVENLDEVFYPEEPVQALVEAVHDRANLEVFRGCTRGCRYCQAGMLYRPMRERGGEKTAALARSIYPRTGYEEFSLLSLNATDYSGMAEALGGIDEFAHPGRLSVSIPSSRLDSFTANIGKTLRSVRPTGLTFAPEAGTQRLRDVINKQLTEEDIMAGLELAFRAGWRKVKLYFMIGLPTETLADIEGIAQLSGKMLHEAMRLKGRSGKTDFTASVGSFVPKPHTPFQWFGMNTPDVLASKQRTLRGIINTKKIKVDTHDVALSMLEGVFARGDRRLSHVIEGAWRRGCRFDGWTEHFRHVAWMDAFAACGLDPLWYATREMQPGDPLPWGHISCGVSEEFLAREYRHAAEAALTPWCGRGGPCSACGVKCLQVLEL